MRQKSGITVHYHRFNDDQDSPDRVLSTSSARDVFILQGDSELYLEKPVCSPRVRTAYQVFVEKDAAATDPLRTIDDKSYIVAPYSFALLARLK